MIYLTSYIVTVSENKRTSVFCRQEEKKTIRSLASFFFCVLLAFLDFYTNVDVFTRFFHISTTIEATHSKILAAQNTRKHRSEDEIGVCVCRKFEYTQQLYSWK